MSSFTSRTHPGPWELERFMAGELSRAESSSVVRHLLTGCPRCVAVTGRLWALGERLRALRFLAEEGLAAESSGPGRLLRYPKARAL